MDIEKIRELRLAHPFQPFWLVLDDGRRFGIDKPYYLAISPRKDMILVATEDGGGIWFPPSRVRETIPLQVTANGSDAGGRHV